MKIWKGYAYPLGSTWMGTGTNFAIYSRGATAVELCLFDEIHGQPETAKIPMVEKADEVWHVFLPDVRPSQLYGYPRPRSLGARKAVSASIPPRSSSIPMPAPSPATSNGRRKCSATPSDHPDIRSRPR